MGNKAAAKSRRSKELTHKDISVLKTSSNLSEEEIKRLHADFLHDFPTGRMDKNGFVKYYEEVKEERDGNSVLCDHIFAVFDTNHDGTIDFTEFLLAVAARSPGDLDSHLDYVFEMCDVSGDGQMDQEELASFLSASLIIAGETDQEGDHDPKKLASDIFNMLGVDGEKKIDKKQFVEGCKKNPALRKLFGGEQ